MHGYNYKIRFHSPNATPVTN
eukprot:COSAG06_NODE_10402_length_1687_cov_1.694584_3_plen_20_part_01